MKFRWVGNSLGIIILLVIAILAMTHDSSKALAQQSTDKIESTLLDQFTTNGSADFIVRFNEQADLSAAYSMDWNSRGEFVYNTLQEAAERSQVNAKAILQERGVKNQTFIAGNELYIWGSDLILANEIAALPEVYFIRATRTYYIDPLEGNQSLQISWAGDLLATHALTTVGSSMDATIDWGIIDSKANQFWTTYGVQGDGIIVANIDTGVQWNHPALDQAFKCGTKPIFVVLGALAIITGMAHIPWVRWSAMMTRA
jgi:hypothetical protein